MAKKRYRLLLYSRSAVHIGLDLYQRSNDGVRRCSLKVQYRCS
jgi:hypothetical protein